MDPYFTVESAQSPGRVSFEVLQARLLAFVKHRIQNGEYTERGLARLLGISQPQIHNVLKGARSLQPALADRMLLRFGITILELLSDAELRDALAQPRAAFARAHTPEWEPRSPKPPRRIGPSSAASRRFDSLADEKAS
jgi:plasmid maintenance system antidote protein VapI